MWRAFPSVTFFGFPLIALWLSAQVETGSLTVSVQQKDRDSLPGALVYLEKKRIKVGVTDARGRTHFDSLAPGTYQLTVNYSRFFSHCQEITISPKDTTDLTITLQEDLRYTEDYLSVRKNIDSGKLSAPEMVRIEKLLDFFTYHLPPAKSGVHHAMVIETGPCPWQPLHTLLRVYLAMPRRVIQPEALNLAFLIDLDGLEEQPEDLDLVKQFFVSLAAQLTEGDRIAIVVGGGPQGLLLPPVIGTDPRLLAAVAKLSATSPLPMEAGLDLAYESVGSGLHPKAVNRVILVSADFYLDVDDSDMVRDFMTERLKSGIGFGVLGFGTGEPDEDMLNLAESFGGVYHFLSSKQDIARLMANGPGDLVGNSLSIMYDVKVPTGFASLIGYKEAGIVLNCGPDTYISCLHPGQAVNYLYEIIPVDDVGADVDSSESMFDISTASQEGKGSIEAILKYVKPGGTKFTAWSTMIPQKGVTWGDTSEDFKFAAAVALFGLILEQDPSVAGATLEDVRAIALQGRGADLDGERGKFIELVERAELLQRREKSIHASGP